jgi:hypothetical protein
VINSSRQGKGEHIQKVISPYPCSNFLYEKDYSEKWYIKRVSYNNLNMNIKNCLSNHVRWALESNVGIEAAGMCSNENLTRTVLLYHHVTLDYTLTQESDY